MQYVCDLIERLRENQASMKMGANSKNEFIPPNYVVNCAKFPNVKKI